MLSPRTERILKSIVGQYIAKATPVPSQSIIDDYELGVSPATIRNEMAYLAQEGYITRPHPSAGSIPSDKGYRYYVESLSEIELPLTEQRLISHLFHQVERELEKWLRLAATLMAQLAQNVAVVTMPKAAVCRLKHLELVALQDSLALLILVLQGARVKQRLMTFDQATSQSELTAIATKLNAAYSNLTSSQIQAKAIELPSTEQQISDCVLEIMAEDEEQYDEPFLDGLHFILNQPEFAYPNRMQDLMELIEHRNLLRAILPHRLSHQRIKIVIGRENEAEVIRDCSVVISQYGLPEEAVGTIGVIGPTRMPYARTISTVGYLSSVLSQLVAELYGRQSPTRPTPQ